MYVYLKYLAVSIAELCCSKKNICSTVNTLMHDWNFSLEKWIWTEFKMFSQALVGISKALEFILNWCYSMHGASSITNKQHNKKNPTNTKEKCKGFNNRLGIFECLPEKKSSF